MAEVLDWPRDNPAEAAVRAAEVLRAGRLVVAPTDTTYALLAHGLSMDAVTRLVQLTGEYPTVVLADPLEVKDWLPNLSGLGARLARNCWPGPLTLQCGAGAASGLCQRLSADVQKLILRDGVLSLRSPGHVAIPQIARVLDGPLLLVEFSHAACLEDVLPRIGQEPVLVINDGPTYFGQSSTVVRVEGKTWTEIKSGVMDREILADLALCRVLFVCNGNTCRSPLAMALCRRLLAQRLGCTVDELPQRGFQVLSAGLAAIIGEMASPEAVEVVREMGGNLEEHRSQPLTIDLLAQADCLFTMTNGHLRMLQSLNLTAGPVPCMLSPTDRDVTDPIGYDIEVYRQCARQILDCLEERLPYLLEL